MFFCTMILRRLNVARCLASWTFVLSAVIVFQASANAGLMCPLELDAEEQNSVKIDIPLTLDSLMMVWEQPSNDRSLGSAAGSTTSPTDDTPSEPVPPEPEPVETTIVGFGPISPVNGTVTGSSDSSGQGGPSSVTAILCSVLDLPIPSTVGRCYAAEVLDIPPTPPLDVLRPPQILA